MAKSSGMGMNLYVDGYDLSSDAGSLSRIGGGPAPLVVTAINKSAFERLGGLRDGAIDFMTFFDVAALAEHAALSPLTTSDRIATATVSTTLGDPAASIVCKQVDYAPTRAADGSLTVTVPEPANGYGLEWGVLLTAGKRTDTGATAGTAVDSGLVGGSAFGLQAYLHVFSFSGTDATIKIQESSDNAGDAYADVVGGGFTTINAGNPAPFKQRIATATNLAVERYLKVTTTTATSFTSLVFAVQVVRNEATPVF
ncbi:MAG TPA: hypothetical protein VF174_08815 [Micromonosporaceae bacterium]